MRKGAIAVPYFWNMSFVGSQGLANALGTDAPGVMISLVMPSPWNDKMPLIKEYNELYLSVLFRPVVGAAPSLLARLLARSGKADSTAAHDAVDACDKLATTILASLQDCDPERLGLYCREARPHSRVLEYLGLLLDAEVQPMPLPHAPLY